MSFITQIVKAGLEGNTVDMKDAFEKEIEERIADKMDDLYQDVADELFSESEELEESLEELDEISRETLASYHKKSMEQLAPISAKKRKADQQKTNRIRSGKSLAGYKPRSALTPEEEKIYKKRNTGGMRARNRLASIDKLSSELNHSYKGESVEHFEESLEERRKEPPKMGVDPLRHMTSAGEKDRRSAAQASSKWRVTFKTKHKPVEVTARNTSEAIRKATASAEKQDVPGSAAYDDVKKIG